MFYLIFYPLCPRGCTITHTEGKSACAASLDLGICWKCWQMELAGLAGMAGPLWEDLKNPNTTRLMMYTLQAG